MKKGFFIALLLVPFVALFAQSTDGPSPVSWDLQLEDLIPIELDAIDLAIIQQEDSINDLDKSLPWRYGVTRPITLNFQQNGVWTNLPNGDRIWRISIKSPEALNLSVNFDDFRLPEGSRLQLYNYDRTDKSKVYTNANNRDANTLGSWYISGDIISVEYFQPMGTSGPLELEIGSIIHGYRVGRVRDLVGGSTSGRGLNDSGACNYDVNCSVGSDFDSIKDVVKKAVALLNLGNGYLCSASLVNNTLQDKTPYLLTANHCLENSDPSLWSIRFNWMSPNPICAENENSTDIQSNFTMSGAQYRASNEESDFALVEMFNTIPSSWDVTFAGWDHSDTNPQFQVGIHHPNGDIMKICRDDNSAVKENANGTEVWLIKGATAGNGDGWDFGTTESGSSGSPLFNENGRIIGQLHGGQSFCNGNENNGDYDVYGRIGVSWETGSTSETRLLDWLDPIGTGQSTIDALGNSLNTIDFELTGQLYVFPNPTSQYVNIINTRYPNLSYRFYNLLGQQMEAGNMSNSENRIDVSQLQEGIYFLHLVDEETNDDITKKIIVTR